MVGCKARADRGRQESEVVGQSAERRDVLARQGDVHRGDRGQHHAALRPRRRVVVEQLRRHVAHHHHRTASVAGDLQRRVLDVAWQPVEHAVGPEGRDASVVPGRLHDPVELRVDVLDYHRRTVIQPAARERRSGLASRRERFRPHHAREHLGRHGTTKAQRIRDVDRLARDGRTRRFADQMWCRIVTLPSASCTCTVIGAPAAPAGASTVRWIPTPPSVGPTSEPSAVS